MAENNNQSIFIIRQDSAYDSNDVGSGVEVTQDAYDAWANDNAVTALDDNGNSVDIVGGNDKISVTDGTTTVGYNNVQQPSTGTGTTSYSTAVLQAADDTLTNDAALAFLQQNVDTAIALRESIITELTALGRDPEKSLTTIDGERAFTLDAADAAIDFAYAALYGYKDNLPALIAELQDLALQTITEYQAEVEGGLTVNLPKDLTPFEGQITTTTTDTTGSKVARSSILSFADTTSDESLPTTDEGDTQVKATKITIDISASKAIRESLGLGNQGPIIEKIIDKAINVALNQIPGYSQLSNLAGTVDKVVRIGDITTNVDLSPAETALALARILIPQVNLVVKGYNLLNGGDGFLGAGGGGGGFGEEEGDGVPISEIATEKNTTTVDNGEDPYVSNGQTTIDNNASTEGGLIQTSATDVGGSYSAVYNPETGTYDVINDDTGTVVLTGLTQQQAILAAEDYSMGLTPDIASDGPVDNQIAKDVTAGQDPSLYPHGLPYDDEGNLMPGWSLDEFNNPVWVGYNSDGTLFVEPATIARAEADREAALNLAAANRARAQTSLLTQQRQVNQGDWRVKLRLAPGSQYLYNEPGLAGPDDGVLWPLKITQGVVFPYTPVINTVYGANYSNYDLTHSNMRGYFYQNSYVDEITIQAVFTAQDTSEANYMLAMIHFFRSVTKMFYGQDAQRGMPPPLVFLQGLGEYQFNMHPCLVKSFSYNLPNDVDYIRARSVNIDGTNLLARRDRQTLAGGFDFLSSIRLNSAGLNPGGLTPPPAPPILGTESPTYVPTRLEVNITLLPTQSRDQVSKQFSLKQFANGDLIKAGFW